MRSLTIQDKRLLPRRFLTLCKPCITSQDDVQKVFLSVAKMKTTPVLPAVTGVGIDSIIKCCGSKPSAKLKAPCSVLQRWCFLVAGKGVKFDAFRRWGAAIRRDLLVRITFTRWLVGVPVIPGTLTTARRRNCCRDRRSGWTR